MDVKTEAFDGGMTVKLAGELDIAEVPGLEGTLRRIEESRPELLVLDLSGLTFIDSSGLRLILMADRRAKEEGRSLGLVAGPERVQRLFRMTGVGSILSFLDRAPGGGS